MPNTDQVTPTPEQQRAERDRAAWAMGLSILIIVLLAALFVVSMIWPPKIFHELREASYARGVITFFIVVAAIAIGMILVVLAFFGPKDDGQGSLFRRGREVHSVLVGVMGTVVGFYFGTTSKEGPDLQLAGPQVVAAENHQNSLTAFVSGGQPPYVYSITFYPQETLNNVTNAVSESGWISCMFATPTNADAKVRITVHDKNDRSVTTVQPVRPANTGRSTGSATNSSASFK